MLKANKADSLFGENTHNLQKESASVGTKAPPERLLTTQVVKLVLQRTSIKKTELPAFLAFFFNWRTRSKALKKAPPQEYFRCWWKP